MDEAVTRLLKEQFQLGLFENPYVDADEADGIVGKDAFRATGAGRAAASIVLLQNRPGMAAAARCCRCPRPRPRGR